MSHLCAILNGVAGVVVFSAPSAVSSAWFPPAERTTATAVGILFNNLGNALSFLAGPAVVPGTRHNTTFEQGACMSDNVTLDNTGWFGSNTVFRVNLTTLNRELMPNHQARAGSPC